MARTDEETKWVDAKGQRVEPCEDDYPNFKSYWPGIWIPYNDPKKCPCECRRDAPVPAKGKFHVEYMSELVFEV